MQNTLEALRKTFAPDPAFGGIQPNGPGFNWIGGNSQGLNSGVYLAQTPVGAMSYTSSSLGIK